MHKNAQYTVLSFMQIAICVYKRANNTQFLVIISLFTRLAAPGSALKRWFLSLVLQSGGSRPVIMPGPVPL